MLASKGCGYLGCLGHGDWAARERLEVVMDETLSQPYGASRVSAGWAHSASLSAEGEVGLWGRTYVYGTHVDSDELHRLDPPSAALRLASGPDGPYPRSSSQARAHSIAPILARLVNATSVALDFGSTVRLRPSPLRSLTAAGIVCGAGVTAAWTRQGELLTMGANAFGQCGVGSTTPVVEGPQRVGAFGTAAGAVSVALGFRHGLCVDDDGCLWAWGKNDNGQLGLGSRDATLVPQRVEALAGARVVETACGLSHSAALDADGQVYVWGKMRARQLKAERGRGLPRVYADALEPRRLALQTSDAYARRAPRVPVTAIACSNFHTVIKDRHGDVWVLGLERDSREMAAEPRFLSGLPPDRQWTLREPRNIRADPPAPQAAASIPSPSSTLPPPRPRSSRRASTPKDALRQNSRQPAGPATSTSRSAGSTPWLWSRRGSKPPPLVPRLLLSLGVPLELLLDLVEEKLGDESSCGLEIVVVDEVAQPNPPRSGLAGR